NVARVADLLRFSQAQILIAFGPQGGRLRCQALGLDASPVRPPEAVAAVVEEETLAEDSNEEAALLRALFGLCERAGARLRRLERGAPAGRGRWRTRSIGSAVASATGRSSPGGCSRGGLLHPRGTAARGRPPQSVKGRDRIRRRRRMTVRREDDVAGLHEAGRVVRRCLLEMTDHVRAGVTTAQLDEVAGGVFRRHGARSAPVL